MAAEDLQQNDRNLGVSSKSLPCIRGLIDTIPLVTPFPGKKKPFFSTGFEKFTPNQGVIPTTPPNCIHFFSGKKVKKNPQNAPDKIC